MEQSNQKEQQLNAKLDILVYLLILLLKKDEELDSKIDAKLAKVLSNAKFSQNQISLMLSMGKSKVNKLLKK